LADGPPAFIFLFARFAPGSFVFILFSTKIALILPKNLLIDAQMNSWESGDMNRKN